MVDNNSGQTPQSLGYSMPAEWEPHEATWISWPHRDGISFPGSYDQVIPVFKEMVRVLVQSEKVCINVSGPDQEAEVRAVLGEISATSLHFFHIPTNEPWCRDHGPIFVTRLDSPQVAVIDSEYNAWGEKYGPFDKDNAVASHMAQQLGLPTFHPQIVLEGGSIEVNGKGTLLTTESCLLNANRNPHLNRGQIEQKLKEFLGVTHILWLGEGIAGDDTDGHVDDLTRFVNPTTVVTAVESDEHDENYRPLQENLMRLREMTTESGKPLQVIALPMPKKIERDGLRLPASYANYYVANRVVLLPVFNDPSDAVATQTLRRCFPGRRVVPIACREFIWGLGAFHCATQQQPKPPRPDSGQGVYPS